MKWIRLNDGSLLNLEKYVYIRRSENSVKYFETDATTTERFHKPSEAEARMRELEKILVQG